MQASAVLCVNRERAYLVATWLSSCAAVHAVRPDLWAEWSECAELFDVCGAFAEAELAFREDYSW